MSEKSVVLGLLKKLGKPKDAGSHTVDLRKLLWSAVDEAIESEEFPEDLDDVEVRLLAANGYDVEPDNEESPEEEPETFDCEDCGTPWHDEDQAAECCAEEESEESDTSEDEEESESEKQEEETPPQPTKKKAKKGKDMTKKTKTTKKTKKKAAVKPKAKTKKTTKKTTKKAAVKPKVKAKKAAKKTTKKTSQNGSPKLGMSAWFRNIFDNEGKPVRRQAVYRRFVKQFGDDKKITCTNYITYAKSDNQYNPLPLVLTESMDEKGRRILKTGKKASYKVKGKKAKKKVKALVAKKAKNTTAKKKSGKAKAKKKAAKN